MKVTTRKINSGDLPGLKGTKSAIYDNAKRQLRDPILKAMDIYKTNVIYGDETETVAEKKSMLVYKQKLKDLDETAISKIPKKIQYYM